MSPAPAEKAQLFRLTSGVAAYLLFRVSASNETSSLELNMLIFYIFIIECLRYQSRASERRSQKIRIPHPNSSCNCLSAQCSVFIRQVSERYSHGLVMFLRDRLRLGSHLWFEILGAFHPSKLENFRPLLHLISQPWNISNQPNYVETMATTFCYSLNPRATLKTSYSSGKPPWDDFLPEPRDPGTPTISAISLQNDFSWIPTFAEMFWTLVRF